MKVILQTSRAGDTFSQSPGDTIEVSDAEARRLIESGQARAVSTGRHVQAAAKTQRNRGGRQVRTEREVQS